jgi:glycerate kinase
VSVLPIGDAGAGFVSAYADLAGMTTASRVSSGAIVTTGTASGTGVVQVVGSGRGVGIPYQESSRPIGEAVAAMVEHQAPQRILLDLAGLWVHDAGAGLLAALGWAAPSSSESCVSPSLINRCLACGASQRVLGRKGMWSRR